MKMSRPALICFLALFLPSSQAHALDPNRQISQYGHTAWRITDGVFSGIPDAIAQTADGYLWIGTNTGLVRYDGVGFVPWIPPDGMRLPDYRVFSLLAAKDGSLWIGTAKGVSHWKNGSLTNYPRPEGRIHAFLEDADGSVWIVREQVPDGTGPLCRISGNDSRCYGKADGIPLLTAMHLVRDNLGNLWIGGFEGLCRWKPGTSAATYFEETSPRFKGPVGVDALAAGPDGQIWAGIERFTKGPPVQRLVHGAWQGYELSDARGTNASAHVLFFDRDQTAWIGVPGRGIYHVHGEHQDQFGTEDGLSGDAPSAFLQDREGTLWVATSNGIDAFHDLSVVSYSVKEGLTSASASTVFAGHDGTVWIGNWKALDFLRGSTFGAIREGQGLPGRDVTTVFEDHTGRVWLGIDQGLWTYDGSQMKAVLKPDGSPMGIVFSITEDTDHDIWVRATPGLVRIRDLQVRDIVTTPQILTAYIIAADPTGGIWLGLVNGDLIRCRHGQFETIPAGPNAGHQVRDLLIEPDDSLWGTTQDELFRLKDGQRRIFTVRNGLPCNGTFGLMKDSLGSLWLSTECGYVAISDSELEKWWKQPDAKVKLRLFDVFDGAQPGLTSLKPQAVRSPDGRLWFVNASILQTIDPGHLVRNEIPPPVYIRRIVADRKEYLPENQLRLPSLTRDLEIDYAALSYVVPQRVQYRYKLNGHDRAWQEPGNRRQAFYSDLDPGTYQFHVIASNNDGVWNETGAALSFTVPPAWYQTNSFRLLCAVFLVFIAWTLYQLRVRQLAATLSARFDERLAERTRLARELHDTLIQTIQGSKMVADDALDESADPVRMRRALERLSEWLAKAMQEGREALNSLRTSTTRRNDLAEGFQRATEDCQVPGGLMDIAVSVEGDAKELHPIVRDEVYRIGYEAIRNACLHSRGSRLDVKLVYNHDLALRVRDNGQGLDPVIAARGKTGHYGLKGMQERAARIGGKLSFVSSANSGTEVRLTVPGKIVFRATNGSQPTLLTKIRELLGRNGRSSGLD
jgi:signal transduction histidine kinase/ligand-binding sensor domain-containing protein